MNVHQDGATAAMTPGSPSGVGDDLNDVANQLITRHKGRV